MPDDAIRRCARSWAARCAEAVTAIASGPGNTAVILTSFIAMGFSIPRGGRVGTRHLGRTAATSKNAQHDKLALANAIGRTRWASSHVVLVIVGSAVAIAGAAVMTGLSYGVAADDVGGKLGVVLVAFVAIYFLGLDLHAVHAHAACFWWVVPSSPMAWSLLIGAA